jgi:hypothetical protein
VAVKPALVIKPFKVDSDGVLATVSATVTGADTVAQPDSANKTALANAARREKWIKVIVMSPG